MVNRLELSVGRLSMRAISSAKLKENNHILYLSFL
jgi:hypothetical protein